MGGVGCALHVDPDWEGLTVKKAQAMALLLRRLFRDLATDLRAEDLVLGDDGGYHFGVSLVTGEKYLVSVRKMEG